jgi:hypothetical protein
MHLLRYTALSIMVAIVGSTSALADPILPTATGVVELGQVISGFAPAFSGFYPSGVTTTYSSGGVTGSFSASDLYGFDPQVSSSLLISGPLAAGQEFAVLSVIEYDFEVSGPAGETVPVTIDGIGQGSISPGASSAVNFYDEALIQVNVSGEPIADGFRAATCTGSINTVACSGNGTTSGSFNTDTTLEITTDTSYTVEVGDELNLNSITGDSTPQIYSAQVSVDPTLTLDTTDPSYSLELSPAPTPEPASIWLILTGAAAIPTVGFIRRNPFRA